MSQIVIRKNGQLHYLGCEWAKRLLKYFPEVTTELLNRHLASKLRGEVIPEHQFMKNRRETVNYIPCLTIPDRTPLKTKTFVENCVYIRKILDLPKQTDLLVQFALLVQVNQELRTLALAIHMEIFHYSLTEILKDFCGIDEDIFTMATTKMSQYGFISDIDILTLDSGDMPKMFCRQLVTEKITSREMLVEPILFPSAHAHFALSDFPHVNTDLVSRYLRAVSQSRSSGVSILLYGESGTGKTEFSRTLAKHCGRRLYEVRSTAMSHKYDDDEFNSRFPNKDRLRYLSMLHSLLTHKSDVMLLIDECENIFESADSQYSKEHLQRFIETNDIPCIWITNHVHYIEPSFVRRFKLAVELPPLRAQEIEQITRPYYKGLGVSATLKKKISQTDNITPALVAKATHIAHTMNAKRSDAESVVSEVVELSLRAAGQWQSTMQYEGELSFNAEYLNIKQPQRYLDDIDFALQHNQPARTLISGPPGTGKTAFAHYLAEANGRELLRVKCSDVLSKWVGESEQKVAALFQQAHDEEKVILLDEVDSLLTSREGLTAHHELQLVNEFLTQIECFTQPLFAATNFVERLDKAVLRRFDFKLECQYLTTPQVLQLYKQVIKAKRLSAEEVQLLSQYSRLTPGDFAILARRKQFRPDSFTKQFAIALLADENLRKQKQTPMGFIRP